MPFCLSTYHNYHHHHLRLIKCGTKFNCRLYGIAAFFLLLSQTWCSTQDIENSDRVPWHRLAPLDKNKWAIENISHHKQRKKLIQRGEETRKAARCNSYSPPLHLIRSRYPALSKKKRQINIVIHNFRLNPPCFYCFHVLFFWAIQSAVTVTNASESIAGEISELTSGMLFFFSLPFVFSSKMGKEWSNGAKHIKRRQSSTNTIKPWSRNYFPRRGSIAMQMFLQFRVSCHKPLNALK